MTGIPEDAASWRSGHERDARVQQATAVSRALLAGPHRADLAELNAHAAALAAIWTELSAEICDPIAREPQGIAVLCEGVNEILGLRHELREHFTGIRFTTLERSHEGLSRLRALPNVVELLPAAAAELARCCGFDRTLICGVRGPSWRAEAVWVTPDHDQTLTSRIQDQLSDRWMPLQPGVLETELIRRRVAVLLHAAKDGAEDGSMRIPPPGLAFVAAPICAGRRVVGFLRADCFHSGRELTTLDRDNIASFADGFSLIFERTALLERLQRQRARAHEAFGAAEHHLAGLDDSETVLIRRDKEAVAVFRTAAGLRKSALSPIDKILTVRERQVIELMVQGARNRRIADELVIAEETVKSHVRAISRKLRASGRADAVSRYLHLRLREGG